VAEPRPADLRPAASGPGTSPSATGPRPGKAVPAAQPRETGSRPGQPGPAGESRPDKPGSAGAAREPEARPGTPAAEPRQSEPAPVPAPKPFSVWEPAPKPNLDGGHATRQDAAYHPEHAEPPSADTQAKLEQLKDLYLTAEAIGEDALVKHFEELSQMQRSLIREFFEKAGLGPSSNAKLLGGDSTEDGASLPG